MRPYTIPPPLILGLLSMLYRVSANFPILVAGYVRLFNFQGAVFISSLQP